MPLRGRDDHGQHPLHEQPRRDRLRAELVAAAVAACGGIETKKPGQAAGGLRSAAHGAGILLSERIAPVDLTLVAASTMGDRLLRGNWPIAARLTTRHAICCSRRKCWSRWRPASRPHWNLPATVPLSRDGASIVGGECRELELPLLANRGRPRTNSSRIGGLRKHFGLPVAEGSRAAAVRHDPDACRRSSTSWAYGRIHAARWTTAVFPPQRKPPALGGLDDTTIEALLRVPIDAAQAEGFVRLPHAMSGATDMDNQPTAVFAHWPGRASCWYEDMRRESTATRPCWARSAR